MEYGAVVSVGRGPGAPAPLPPPFLLIVQLQRGTPDDGSREQLQRRFRVECCPFPACLKRQGKTCLAPLRLAEQEDPGTLPEMNS